MWVQERRSSSVLEERHSGCQYLFAISLFDLSMTRRMSWIPCNMFLVEKKNKQKQTKTKSYCYFCGHTETEKSCWGWQFSWHVQLLWESGGLCMLGLGAACATSFGASWQNLGRGWVPACLLCSDLQGQNAGAAGRGREEKIKAPLRATGAQSFYCYAGLAQLHNKPGCDARQVA